VLFDVQAVILTMLFIFSRISAPAMQLSQMLQQFASAVPAHAEFSQLERELAAHDAPPAPVLVPGAIVFRDVSFQYDRSSRSGGIERLNLTIAPGSFLGVSGPTGAGKTTFADLLIGLLEPNSGEISVGGTPLRSAAATKWRDRVSYVVQDPYLFRDTIRRNLLWAKPQATDAEIWDALASPLLTILSPACRTDWTQCSANGARISSRFSPRFVLGWQSRRNAYMCDKPAPPVPDA
jgi:ATP-binding cassette subfamily C protein